MNYSRHREAAKKALEEKQQALAQMTGENRTKAEKIIIEQAIIESEAQEQPKQDQPKKRGRPSTKAE
jgi:hypothetical protein